jgi:cell wall-associated NlpC family hydrolase
VTRPSFDPTVSNAAALSFRRRANALIPVLDTLNRQCALPDSVFQGAAATAYQKRQKTIADAVTTLIDAYNRCAQALEELTPHGIAQARHSVGSTLATVKDLEERLASLLSRPLPKSSPTLQTASIAVQAPALTRTLRERLEDRIPSRPAKNGVPSGFSSKTFRSLLKASIAAAPSDRAASVLLWGSQNLGMPYNRSKRQRPGFFDCSSFVSRAMETSGVEASIDGMLADTAMLLSSFSAPGSSLSTIDPSDVKPGDLLFYSLPNRAGTPPTQHVVMVLANGYIMHAPSSGSVTRIERMNTALTPIAARRIRSN